MDRASLRDVIRRKLDDGDLPTKLPVKMYAGNGGGAPCDACGDPILSAQTEYEWGYPEDDQPRAFRMHVGCVGLWEAQRRQRGLDPAL
jgi:hypothetical protein